MSLKSWWNSLWEGNQNVDENGLPRLTETLPMPEVKPCKPEKGVSEPVLSFVNAVKKDPKRFLVKKGPHFDDGIHFYGSDWIKYGVVDSVAKKTFSCTIIKDTTSYGYGANSPDRVFEKSEPWLTDEEVLYVINELEYFFKEKVERVKSKIEKRARERLTKLYKGE
jgi:hypothetical protein